MTKAGWAISLDVLFVPSLVPHPGCVTETHAGMDISSSKFTWKACCYKTSY